MIKEIFDNQHYKTDKFTGHSYLDTYEEFLSPKKDSAKNILEIGVSAGGSILLWRDYFINAQVYGVDIEETPPDILNSSPERITIIKQNAYDLNFMKENFLDKNIKFDILMDDGPHTLDSFHFFARHYSSLLAPQGVLVIEDIPELELTPGIINCFPEHLRSLAKVVDLRHVKNKWDDILIVLQT